MERVGKIAARTPVGSVRPDSDARRAREQFRQEVEHFAAAYRHELVDETIRVYWEALKGIPQEIRTAGLTRCVYALKFFPTVAEILHACADIVDERRKAIAKEGERIKAECPLRQQGACNGVHRETHNGVVACNCHKDAVALLARADAPIKRPALPVSTEDQA